MGRISPKKFIERARENGFKDDMTGISDSVVLTPLVPWTERLYDQIWMVWVECKEIKPAATPHDIPTAKHFVEFLALCSKGQEGRLRPSTHSTYMYWRRFYSIWERETCNPIPKYVRNTIKNVWGRQSFLHIFVANMFIWQHDWHEYKHDGIRIRNTCLMQQYAFSSGRIGELVESSARGGSGKGLHFGFRRLIYSSLTMMAIKFQRYAYISVENMRRDCRTLHMVKGLPQHPLYEGITIPVEDPVMFIITTGLAMNAFREYTTIHQILAVRPKPDMVYALIKWKDGMLNKPFHQTMTSAGFTGRIVSSSSFDKDLGCWSLHAGYEKPIRVHHVRKEALIKADDNGYSMEERMKFAGHRNPNTFRWSYMAPMSTVDGQGSFLNTELRRDHIEDFRSLSLPRQPQLLQSLPAKEQYALESRPDFIAIEDKIQELTEKIWRADTEARKQEL
ncbi:hypothetical protein K469DRAFT_758244 [Zopfia rhizophila CBS 207.26]|uniref:Uncharacterized protein n=1 Tax=Zopfia rhizophila CBS 207.26 TaxID=1314779 RepID=A0A6A6EXX3_9PEZI|nr:hypothetical protein K469DRAFT_758244 [Zopfia rhizophila CBS 207.26]